jgi:hypothetical protein
MRLEQMPVAEIEAKILARLDDGTGRAFDPARHACRYRTSEELACAIGCLIPDGYYTEKIEGTSVAVLSSAEPGRWNGTYVCRTSDLQLCKVLNALKIPTAAHQALVVWQRRHDNGNNWNGTTYVGPRTFVGAKI